SSRRRHTRFSREWSSDVCSSDLDEFSQTIAALITEHAPDFDPATIEFRASRQGTYLSLTAVVPIQSREQLERLYHALAEHPLVKIGRATCRDSVQVLCESVVLSV